MEEKGSTNLFVVIILIISLILVSVSTVMAWYSNEISSNQRIIATSRNLTVDYIDGNVVSLKNINPGTTRTYIFKVSADSKATRITNYEINFSFLSNNFASANLLYRIREVSNTNNLNNNQNNMELTPFNEQAVPPIKSSVNPGEEKVYTLTVVYTNAATSKKNLLNASYTVKLINE